MITNKEVALLCNSLIPLRHKCKCGHTVIVLKDKEICRNCGKYVFKTKKDEYQYRVKELLKRGDKIGSGV